MGAVGAQKTTEWQKGLARLTQFMGQWWIDYPKILGSSNLTTGELETFFEQGFRTIISLLDETKQCPRYDVDALVALGYQRYNIPVEDFTAPTFDQLEEFSAIVSACSKAIVHCQGGVGRTGTMAAAYWISKGLFAEQAISKTREQNKHAIETKSQEQVLRDWEAKQV